MIYYSCSDGQTWKWSLRPWLNSQPKHKLELLILMQYPQFLIETQVLVRYYDFWLHHNSSKWTSLFFNLTFLLHCFNFAHETKCNGAFDLYGSGTLAFDEFSFLPQKLWSRVSVSRVSKHVNLFEMRYSLSPSKNTTEWRVPHHFQAFSNYEHALYLNADCRDKPKEVVVAGNYIIRMTCYFNTVVHPSGTAKTILTKGIASYSFGRDGHCDNMRKIKS